MPSWQATTWTNNTGHFVDTVQDMELSRLWINYDDLGISTPKASSDAFSVPDHGAHWTHAKCWNIVKRFPLFEEVACLNSNIRKHPTKNTCFSSLCLHVGIPKQLPVESMFQLHCEILCETLPQAVNTVATVLGTEGIGHQKHRS